MAVHYADMHKIPNEKTHLSEVHFHNQKVEGYKHLAHMENQYAEKWLDYDEDLLYKEYPNETFEEKM